MWQKLLSRFKYKHRQASGRMATEVFRKKYFCFKTILESNSELLKIISDFEEKLGGNRVFPLVYITNQTARIIFHAARMIQNFELLAGRSYGSLTEALNHTQDAIHAHLDQEKAPVTPDYVLPYGSITKEMVGVAGGKNANLGEVLSLGLPIPKGFVITTTAFKTIIRANDLMDEIRMQKMSINPEDPESIDRASDNIQKLFLDTVVPEPIETAIFNAYDQFVDKNRKRHVALRSSAIGEDSDLSFAGQYLTVLNVPPENILKEYLKVLASLFSPRAIFYRLYMGIPFGEADMSVGCLEMINAKSSGVLYSSNPYNLMDNTILINALWGLGTSVVDGTATPDVFKISREPELSLISTEIAQKPRQVRLKKNGYITEQAVDGSRQKQPCLSPGQALLLAKYALAIEKHYRCPQDIEWAVDENNQVILLQARPLRVESHDFDNAVSAELSGRKVILDNGNTACPGFGYGPAFPVHTEKDLKNFPTGSVLVATQSSPLYVMVMKKAAAIIVESGSITGHMASLAREFKVPTVLNLKGAMSEIKKDDLITVDAFSGRVYKGEVPELLALEQQKNPAIIYTPVYQTLKQISGYIVPLNLTDPNSAEFTPDGCRTVHDIMRYIHEKSYGEMFTISDFTTDYGNISLKLDASLPLDLYVIDLGQGLINHTEITANRWKITLEDITSAPFKAVLIGMLHKGLRQGEPRPVNIKGFLSVMSEQMLSPQSNATSRFGDKSYAIITDRYLNFSSRVGYHYSILDAYCSPVHNMNYINFSFMGGAADYLRRNRRARLIQQVMHSMEFLVEVHGDRVTARFSKQPEGTIVHKLDLLGRLLIYTRQMDMLMHTEQSIDRLAERFLKEDYHIAPV